MTNRQASTDQNTKIAAGQAESASRTTADAVRFSMRGEPLLASGATMRSLGTAGNLWAHVKVYSSGGENGMHCHDVEDHCFVVLQGEATFQFGDGSTLVAHSFEGVMLPKGTFYQFSANPAGNLVMIRVGGAQVTSTDDIDPKYGVPREISRQRVGVDNRYFDGESAANGAHSQPIRVLPDQFFAAD
ncbi:cupin domain-containing protein [Paraburkholderia sp. RL18-101-BIB-B]|uniref:cupin domain-containing protein n=1 Tax=unclassified Paraburkholderia TaxID=2615204 RepID=UPI0038BD4D08